MVQAPFPKAGDSVWDKMKADAIEFMKSKDVRENDVIFGRGAAARDRRANQKYRLVVESHSAAYKDARSPKSKSAIVIQVIEEIQSWEPPGRFLKQVKPANRNGPGCMEIESGDGVMETIKQALRDATRPSSLSKRRAHVDQSKPTALLPLAPKYLLPKPSGSPLDLRHYAGAPLGGLGAQPTTLGIPPGLFDLHQTFSTDGQFAMPMAKKFLPTSTGQSILEKPTDLQCPDHCISLQHHSFSSGACAIDPQVDSPQQAVDTSEGIFTPIIIAGILDDIVARGSTAVPDEKTRHFGEEEPQVIPVELPAGAVNHALSRSLNDIDELAFSSGASASDPQADSPQQAADTAECIDTLTFVAGILDDIVTRESTAVPDEKTRHFGEGESQVIPVELPAGAANHALSNSLNDIDELAFSSGASASDPQVDSPQQEADTAECIDTLTILAGILDDIVTRESTAVPDEKTRQFGEGESQVIPVELPAGAANHALSKSLNDIDELAFSSGASASDPQVDSPQQEADTADGQVDSPQQAADTADRIDTLTFVAGILDEFVARENTTVSDVKTRRFGVGELQVIPVELPAGAVNHALSNSPSDIDELSVVPSIGEIPDALVPEEDCPNMTFEEKQREFELLPADEKASALSDVFGKLCHLEPSPKRHKDNDSDRKSVDYLLDAMEKEIDRVPSDDKQAMLEAKVKANPSEFSRRRLKLFLQHEGLDVKKAAERFVAYWSARRDLFGPDRFYLPMTLGGALDGDTKTIEALEAGFGQILPGRDASGRQVTWVDGKAVCRPGYTVESNVRADWYTKELMAEQPNAQKGFVRIYWAKDSTIFDYDLRIHRGMQRTSAVVPIPYRACHVCGFLSPADIGSGSLFSAIQLKKDRIRTVFHEHSDQKLLDDLAEFGIEPELVPSNYVQGGQLNWSPEIWMASLSKLEGQPSTKQNAKSTSSGAMDCL